MKTLRHSPQAVKLRYIGAQGDLGLGVVEIEL